MSPTQLSFLDASSSRVRRHDPRPAKRAAAQNATGRASQASRILRWLWTHPTITADQAWRELTIPEDGTPRGEWSTRLGMLVDRGLLERAGEVEDVDRRGRTREVLAYRLTDAGHAECDLMFGGHA